MASHLYVSFWDLCLDNLPQGRFERRVIGAGEASAMICAARADKTLLCVSKDDLLAPYRTKERRRHQELCTVLRASYNCPLRFEDFLTTLDDEGTAVQSITPLQVAELQPHATINSPTRRRPAPAWKTALSWPRTLWGSI